MSHYYRPQRTRNIYDPESKDFFKISRSKLDLFLNCPHCFYLDRRLGIGQPPSFPFNLNSAVDTLLKKEFDYYRAKQEPHPLCQQQGIDAIPYQHAQLNEWRDALRRGIQFQVPETNLILTGGVDDIWINKQTQELIVVDYKATSKLEPVTLDADWQIGYKRQAEIYQWLFRKNGFSVLDLAYFVYCNGRTDSERFDQRLEFHIDILPYQGNANWVEDAVRKAYACLQSDIVPPKSAECDFCQYVLAASRIL